MSYWQNKINSITNEFLDNFGNIPPALLSISPLGKWSIAQHVNHLIKRNESYFPTFDAIMSHKHKKPRLSWFKPWVNLCGEIVYRAAKPETINKTKTFDLWKPDPVIYTEDLWNDFVIHQARLIEYYKNLADLPGQNIIIISPADSKVIYPLEIALLVIPAHELRHLNQALELKKQLISR